MPTSCAIAAAVVAEIAGDHDGANAHVAQFGDQACQILARRIADRDKPDEAQRVGGAEGDGNHAMALSGEAVHQGARIVGQLPPISR